MAAMLKTCLPCPSVRPAKLLSPSIVSVTGSGSRGPTLRFLRPANAGE